MTAPANIVEISVLGPLLAMRGEVDVTPTAQRERTILALLALDPRLGVSSHRLTEALWRHDPPPTARNSIQVAVSRLRKQLGASTKAPVLSTTPIGYALHADDVRVDAYAFVTAFDAIQRMRREPDAEAASLAEATREALGMWRDRHALFDLQASVDVLVLARQLERKRLDLVELLGTLLLPSDPRSAVDAVEHDAHLEWDRPRLQLTYLEALVANGSSREARRWSEHLVELHEGERTPMDPTLAEVVALRS